MVSLLFKPLYIIKNGNFGKIINFRCLLLYFYILIN